MFLVNWFLSRASRQIIGEIVVFSINGAETTGYSHTEEWIWISTSKTHTKVKKYQRFKCENLNYIFGRKCKFKYLWPLIRQWFLRYATKTTREKTGKLKFIKIKNVCASKSTVNEVKNIIQTEWEKFFFKSHIWWDTCNPE